MKFQNTEEESLWAQVLVAYLQNGGSTMKGAHLKFADRCIEGRRNRQLVPSPIESAVTSFVKAHGPHGTTTAKDLAKLVSRIVQTFPEAKIQGIKQIRAEGDYGLKDAKDLYELVRPMIG